MTSQRLRTTEERAPRPRHHVPGHHDVRERLLADLPVAERRLRLNGTSTAILEGGEGPPIVLLHGPGEYAAKWLRVIPALSGTHRVIAPDLPGHGASEAIEGPVDEHRVLAWLDDLIECTCPTPPVLIGHLFGGAIAARFAVQNGERLARLVLVDALGLAPFQPEPEFGQALMEFVGRPTKETHDRLWRRCAFDLDALRRSLGEQWDDIEMYNLDRARAPDLRDTQQGLMQRFGLPAIPHADLERIAVPTTLIWGRHDLATPLRIAEAASTRYGWPLHVIDNAADDPSIERPDAFVAALREALHDSASSTTAGQAISAAAAWDRIAAGYDELVTPTHLQLAGEALGRADLRPGMRLLDVAAGSGAVSLAAARLGAKVTAVDISPGMVERLKERASAEGLDLSARVMDGHALDLENDTFDMVASQFGVMLFPDLLRGLREMVRVAKPGGRVVVVAFGSPAKVEFLDFFIRAIRTAIPEFTGLPMDPPPLPFQVSDPGTLRSRMSSAGLRDVRVEQTVETTRYRSGRELWNWVTNSNPIPGAILDRLDPNREKTAMIQQALDAMVRERAGETGTAILSSPINMGIGTK